MTFGILGNTAKPATAKVTSLLITFLRQKKLPFVAHDRLAAWLHKCGLSVHLKSSEIVSTAKLPSRCDVIIALGGDGTMLEAARIVGAKGTLLLGVNLGKLGFMAEVSPAGLKKAINELLENNYTVDERMVIEATCLHDNRKFRGLNDIVIDRGSSARMIEIETYVNDEYLVTYASDGIILSTPTGSTAYSLATGGPIVVPKSNVMMISPIAPHTLTARPVIIADGSLIRIVARPESKRVHITADGQIQHTYDTPVEFIARKADYTVNLIKRKQSTYFDVLRTKLLWGRDIRVKNLKVR